MLFLKVFMYIISFDYMQNIEKRAWHKAST